MYQNYYGLTEDPFQLGPNHRFCQRHTTFSKAKAYMQYAVHRAEGFVMITGRPGTGKTTLIDDVLDEIEGREIISAKLVSAQMKAEDLLRMTVFNFGISAQNKNKSELLTELQGFFANCITNGKRPLLVVDEAQGLSMDALEELRLLTNLRINGQAMLQIFLVGQQELRELVLNPRMEQLHQRMIATCHLEPLDFKQTAAYVMHRLRVAGWQYKPRLHAHLFPQLYRFSQGIPRCINLFMSRLLLHGELEQKSELSEQDAWIVLEELKSEHLTPIPANELLDEVQMMHDAEEIDVKLLMPDPKNGNEWIAMDDHAACSRDKDASSLPVSGTWSIPHEPATGKPVSKATETAAPQVLQVSQWEGSKCSESPSMAVQPPRASHRLYGLAVSLLVAMLIMGSALLLVPVQVPTGGFGEKLWVVSGIGSLRAQMFHWSNGALPLFSPGKTEYPEKRKKPHEVQSAAPVSWGLIQVLGFINK